MTCLGPCDVGTTPTRALVRPPSLGERTRGPERALAARMIARILVALDASERAPDVLAAAAEVASSFGATLVPFRALTIPPDFPPAGHTVHGDPLPGYLLNEATLALEVTRALIARTTERERATRSHRANVANDPRGRRRARRGSHRARQPRFLRARSHSRHDRRQGREPREAQRTGHPQSRRVAAEQQLDDLVAEAARRCHASRLRNGSEREPGQVGASLTASGNASAGPRAHSPRPWMRSQLIARPIIVTAVPTA